MIWLLCLNAAGFTFWVGALVLDGGPYSRPHLPAFLTHRTHTTSGD